MKLNWSNGKLKSIILDSVYDRGEYVEAFNNLLERVGNLETGPRDPGVSIVEMGSPASMAHQIKRLQEAVSKLEKENAELKEKAEIDQYKPVTLTNVLHLACYGDDKDWARLKKRVLAKGVTSL